MTVPDVKRVESCNSDRAASETGTAADSPILFFDGVCGLCSRSVDFVLARDRANVFRFAPLQGETAAACLGTAAAGRLDSMVLVDRAGIHRRSTAVVRVLWRLRGGWRLVAALLWVMPRPVRDLGYDLVARCRYRLFGKRESCRVPSPDERTRFLP